MKQVKRLLRPLTALAALAFSFAVGMAVDDDRDLTVRRYDGAAPTVDYEDDKSEPIRARQACNAWDEFQSMVANVETIEHAQMVNSMILLLNAQAWATRLWDDVNTYTDIYLNRLAVDSTQQQADILSSCGDLRENET